MIGQIVQKIPRTWYRCNDGTFSSHNRKSACNQHCGLATGKPVRLVNADARPRNTAPTVPNQASDIVLIPLAEIFTNPEWFQNREKAFSLRSVENIVSAVENGSFTWANFDAITVWLHQGKYYILSGHSRTEAFTRLCAMRATAQGRDFCRIPAKIVTGISLDEAKRIAMESNTLSTRESDLERAQYYRRQLATGTPMQEVKAAAARMEGKESVKVLAFAQLNPNGKTALGLRALENADQTSRNNLANIARWIGNARQTVPVLTDRHENELYDWLVTDKAYGTAKGQISNENEFKARLAAILQKRTAFGVLEDSLNIQGSITKTPTEQTYDGQVVEALQLVTELDKQYKEKIRSLTERGATEAKIQELTAGLQASLTRARVNYQNLLLKRNEVAQASRNDLSLFGIGRIVKEKPPGLTQCLDGSYSTYIPGRGVCSYHGGPVWIKSGTKQARLPKEPMVMPVEALQPIVIHEVVAQKLPHQMTFEEFKKTLEKVYVSYRTTHYRIPPFTFCFVSREEHSGKVSYRVCLLDYFKREPTYKLQEFQYLGRDLKEAIKFSYAASLKLAILYGKQNEIPAKDLADFAQMLGIAQEATSAPIQQPTPQPTPQQLGFYRISNYTARNGKSGQALEVVFTAIPAEQIRTQLKEAYFWFTPQDKLWRAWDTQERRDLLERLGIRPGETLPQVAPTDRPQRVITPAEPRVVTQAALAQKLRSLAQGMQAQIDRKFDSPLKNTNPTARRANIISSMEKDGERLQKFQSMLLGLAALADQNQLPPELQKIDSRALLETIFYFKEYPSLNYEMHQRNLKSLLENLKGAKGVPALRDIIERSAYRKTFKIDDLQLLKQAFQTAKRRNPKLWVSQTEEEVDRIMRLTKAGITPDNFASVREQLLSLVKAPDQGNQAERQVQQMIYNLIGVKIPGYFNTPPAVVERLMSVADIRPGQRVLEPSAGAGDIADAIRAKGVTPDVVEIASSLRKILEAKGYQLVGYDFMEYNGGPYDRIVMNPPFENAQEIDHVLHAFQLLAPGGRIVSVMSEGPFFRQDKKATAFRDFLESFGYSEPLPAGSFLKSRNSTGVNTRIVVIEKPYSATMSGIRRYNRAL
jgi:protein-L-isoaspartate O-methyltransferase